MGAREMENAPQMKPWIEAIHAYVPGLSKGADGRELVKLSANENPLGTSPAATAVLSILRRLMKTASGVISDGFIRLAFL